MAQTITLTVPHLTTLETVERVYPLPCEELPFGSVLVVEGVELSQRGGIAEGIGRIHYPNPRIPGRVPTGSRRRRRLRSAGTTSEICTWQIFTTGNGGATLEVVLLS